MSSNRAERTLRKSDLQGVECLYDSVHDEYVEIVEKCVGCVYLRYPHQKAVTRYECDCGAVRAGMDEIETHVRECGDSDGGEWFDLMAEDVELAAKKEAAGEMGFQRYEPENEQASWNHESYSYSWPLDGHRFSTSDGPEY